MQLEFDKTGEGPHKSEQISSKGEEAWKYHTWNGILWDLLTLKTWHEDFETLLLEEIKDNRKMRWTVG